MYRIIDQKSLINHFSHHGKDDHTSFEDSIADPRDMNTNAIFLFAVVIDDNIHIDRTWIEMSRQVYPAEAYHAPKELPSIACQYRHRMTHGFEKTTGYA